MKNFILSIFILLFITSGVFGQGLTGIKTIPGNYPTISTAVDSLNFYGVGAGGVTFNIAANYTQTITATISLTTTGTVANPVLFQKDPATSGANPLITAYIGGVGTPASAVQDGIWRLSGSDYVTISSIDVRDNPANTSNPSTMEYGYALYKASSSNGCQFITIQNCTITLNRINNATGIAPMTDGSAGIIVMNASALAAVTPLTAVAGGSNSNNKFYGNTIQNCSIGISMIGYAPSSGFTLADTNNDIGGSSSVTGNTIINYGGVSGAPNPAAAIRTLAQYGLNVSYNTTNNNNGGGFNHPNILRGIYINAAKSASSTITYNTVTVKGGGTTQQVTAIENLSGSTAASNTVNISNNKVTNCTYATATTGNFFGIYNSGTPAILTINTDTISNNSSAATSAVNTTGLFYEIYNSGAAATVAINNNVISGNSTATSIGTFIGIYNTASTPALNINSNTLAGDSTATITGLHYSIYNSGTVTTTTNINSNNIGTAVSPAIKFTAANTTAQLFIYNSKGGGSSALSISNNNFYNVLYSIATAGTNTYIINSAATKSQAINSNVFNNLNVNISGSLTFISNSVAVPSTGTQNVNSNSINGTFSKTTGGTVTFFTSSATSVAGSIINNNNNNFSNITLTGATTMAGWVNTDAGSPAKTIQNNTFSNWTTGTGAVTAMNVNITSTNNAVTGNLINNISGAAAVTGITTAAGNDKIYSNTINTLSTTGAAAVTGILVTAGTNKNIYSNKIYDLSANNATATVSGITVSGTTVITANIYNNLIGDLRSPVANSATDVLRGINIIPTALNSTINVYYNTVYLNATSSGAAFSSTGIYHTASATATTGTLNLRNNIVTNTSTPNGTGLTVAYRISSATLTNYSNASNNNLFYAGVPGTNRLIFYDAVNLDQSLSIYKTRVATRDAQSVTEDLIGTSKFLSTSGASASFLHLDPTKATQAESNAGSIASVTTDFDAQIRQGSTGYTGSGTAPDIGSDEIAGTTLSSLSGNYNVGTGQTFTSLTGTGGLFAGINSLGLSGNIVVNITSDLTEDGTNVLYQWVEKGVGNYTITIQPNASTIRIISGNVLNAMISFNGAKRVTIDGSNGTLNNYLTFRNTNTPAANGTAFTFINGATNNTIKYCNIEAAANATNGVMLFSTSVVASGNSNNTISNCSINATVGATTGNVCIYSSGTVGNENATNIITNNKIYNYRDRALDVAAIGSKSWTIGSNSFYNGDVSGASYIAASTLHGIRILGGAGYTISNNYIGGNAPLASGTIASYSSAGILSFQGILLTTSSATPASSITGNTVTNISVSAVPTVAASANVFIGIETNGSGINVGGPLTGDGNIIGSNTINGAIAITTTTSSTTFLSVIKGINCNSTGGLVIANQVGGIDINNVGTAPAASTFNGIFINSATAPTQINNNIIGSTGSGAAANSIRVLSTSTSTTTFVTGIAIGSSVVSAVQVDGNIIKNISFLSSATSTLTAGGLMGISSAATGAASVTITNNTITKNSIVNYTTGLFYGIYNSGAASTVSINNNILNSNSSNSTTGLYYAINNAGAVTTAININNNSIGNSSSSAFTFNAANSVSQIFINNAAGASTAALSISNNNFQDINYFVAGTGSNTYILNSGVTLSQTINGNTFTNLNVNTSGNITFISNNVALSATGSQNVNNNSIVTGFTKKATGIITLFTTSASSAGGSIINNNNNNFSNITVLTTTTIAGWSNMDIGTSVKTIQNNTFSNWVGNSGSMTAIAVNSFGANSNTTGNIINNISSAGAILGITTGAGNDNIYSNTINTLFTTGAFAVSGIYISAGTLKNIYKNKIYDLSGSNSGSTVNGILIFGGTTVNVYNNLIGDLRTPAASASDPIRGISITSIIATSNINVYYNTIYLNASSTGALFGTTGIYHASSATATTVTLDLRNNSITNISSIKGAAYTVAFRRSAAALNNYATTSNNNLFYAGSPGATKLLYWDGATGDQALANYKTRVSTRDASSVTEDITAKFLSTAGSSSVFLHMISPLTSAIESGGVNIAGYTDDYDGQIRAGNTGYTGGSTLPDIGADEVFGIETIPPAITYTPLINTTVTTNRDLTGVTITDASGVNTAAGTKPRIYYKRSTDANVWLDNTSSTNGWKYKEATNSTSPFNFTIDYTLLSGGAAVTAGAIQYFIVAQDNATTANVAINSGTFAATPSSVALTSTSFPISGTVNSYNIAFAGTYNVGATEVFTSLTKADGLFASINSAGLMGNATFIITSNLTEDGTNALNQWAELGAGNYTLTIQPDAATLRVISGNVPTGLIRLNGADRVTIDGSISGAGKYLSFKNTNISGTTGTAFTFINGATNNTLRYCDVQAFTDATNGVVLFGSSAIAGGNSNDVIDNCTINSTVAGNTGNIAIYSTGTAGNENSSNIISNNNIYNYRDRGLDITGTGSTAWTISGNSFYNGSVTGTINYPFSSALHGIRILGGSGYTLLNNYIGGSGTLASGANAIYSSTLGNVSYQGILLTTGSASPASNIKGNTIAAITLSSVPTAAGSNAFTGIETNGSGINIGGSSVTDGNFVGSSTSNGSIVVTTSTASVAYITNITGINCLSGGGVINNNQVSGFDVSNVGAAPAPSVVQGIYVNNASSPTQINNNLIGSTSTSNSIRVLSASTSATTSLTGIGIGTSANSATQVNNNRIENISNLSTTSSGSFTGINNAATLSSAVLTISSDTIQYVNTAANSNVGSAIYSAIVSSSAATISNNLINSITLSSTGTNAQITGLNISGSYASTVSGNIISNLSTVSNKTNSNVETGSPSGSAIIGILNSASAAGQIINNNRFSGFSATSNAGIDAVVTGIGITSTGSGNIFNNRFGTMINLATGAAPALCHIVGASGTFNVYNNTLRISNLTNTNSLKIYGIIDASATTWNYFHNTVRVGGSSSGAPLRSAAFLLSVNSSPVLKDNIFFNIRTGAGYNYAVSNLSSPPSTWTATTSDYNDFYSINSNTIAEWGNGTGKTFAEWKSLTGGDIHSISNPISFITSTYDLEPDSVSNCAFDNAGTPITTPVLINTDINSKLRNNTNPDLGAYEFSYTGFTIIASNNSPVCAGDSVTLSVNPGNALSPHFIWRDSANTIISTLQNPTLALPTGRYKVTVTDSTGCFGTDSTLVLTNQRPTARITSQTSLCDSGSVNLNISVTGAGTINGTLNNGDPFSGTAPLIVVAENVTSTTSFSISSLTDSLCTATPADVPDTVTIMVTHKGDWLGITSNWSDPVNWCGGILPTSTTDVTIPAAISIMPVIGDSARCNSLLISTGDSLSITAAGVLSIAGTLTNNGVYKDNGTTNFNGTSGQQTFSGVTTFNNLTLNNAGGLLLPIAIVVNNLLISAGILNANNFGITLKGNWTNNASASAFTAGTAIVTFNGTTAQSIGGAFATGFNNLTIAPAAATVTLNINANISGNLLVSTGTFDLAGFTANRVSAGGTITISNNATLKVGGTNTFPANYTTHTLVVASTVEYSGTNQTVANELYGNLKFSSSGGVAIKTLPATAFTVVGNLTSTLGAGTSVSFTAGSNITVNGNVSIGASTSFNGGSYFHIISGNWTNNGTFTGSTSTISFSGSGTIVGGTGSQNFNNLTVAASGVSFSNNSITLTGNLATTLSGSFTQASGGTLIMSGTGKTISGSGISLDNLSVTGTVTISNSLNLTGNLAVIGSFSGGANTITMSGTSKTISGSGTIAFYILNSTGSITSSADFSIASSLLVNGSFSASAGTATFTGTSSLNGTANLYNVTVNGTSVQLSSGSVLGIANVLTITSGILDVTTSGPNTVNFNGTGAQNINAITYSNLVLSNGNTKTAVGNVTTNYDITIGAGTTFNLSSYTFSTYGNWVNNGTFISGTSTVQFVGLATSYINGITAFNILTSNTSSSTTELFLNNSVSAATVHMTNGIIETGSDTLTIFGTRNGNGYIYGNIRRIHTFLTGVPYSFEGPQNTITFLSLSSVNDIMVSVNKGTISDFPFGGSISRVYKINIPTGTYNATLRLHYEDDELNGNDEATMALWHYNGSSWGAAGKTANSTTFNYVELSGLTDITNRWTASGASNLVQWNGSVSTDWNTAANWTVLQGSGSRPPSSADIVDLGTATFINQPTIANSVTVKNIVFGSAKAVTLTLGSGGSLTTLGDLNGNWNGNATHTINVNNQSLTVNGNLDLSDGTNGHAINLNIGAGTVTIANSISESGGANIIFSGAGTLSIFQDFNYSSGIFTAGSGTVIYNGTENQEVAGVNYNNLTVIKAAGLAEINDTVNIAGNLLDSSGELDNHSLTSIAGNVTISGGGTIFNYQVLHVQGNWNNNGTYGGIGSSVYFDGSGSQSITATTFNNLIINKPSGTALLTGNALLTGDFTISSGTLDIQAYTFDRNLPGGTATTANGATFMIGADNPPRNFTNNIIGPSSTTIFYGTTPQYIGLAGITFGNLIFRGTGLKTVLEAMTVNGDLTIDNLSGLDATSATITLNGNWINNGTFIPSTGTILCNGTTKTLSGTTTFNKVTVTGSYTILNDVTFNGLLNITSVGSFSAGGTIHTTLNGDLTNSGILYTLGTTTFTGNVVQTLSLINAVQTVAITVNFNGSVSPLLNSTSSPQFGFLNINNTGGVNPSVGWIIAYSMTVGSGASFNAGSSSHTIYGSLTNNGTIISSGTISFLPASAATVNLGTNFSSTGRVYFGGAGALTLAGTPVSFSNVNINNTNSAGITPSSDWHLTNNLRIVSGSILNAGNHNYLIGGNVTNSGTINSGTSTFTLNGTGIQDINSASPFYNLTINKASGTATLSSNVTVNNVLNFIAGNIQTGGNVLSLPAAATLTGAGQGTGWVNGNLQKNAATGSNVSRTFEIGDDNNYTPATVLFSSVSAGGDLTVNSTAGEHPQIDFSGINKNLDVNRYWTLTNSGIGFTTAAATFNWVTSDLDAGAVTANFKTSSYNGSIWGFNSFATPLPTSIQATGLTSFGSFAIGEGYKSTLWTGAAGTSDWFTATNWYGGVPDTTVETTIPTTLQSGRIFPVISSSIAAVDSITIQNAASLTVNSVLKIKGAVINNGTFNAGNGTIEMNGSGAQTIAANTFANNTISNLIISNNVTLGGQDSITGSLSFGASNKTFNTAGFLTLKSSLTTTAAVADITNGGVNSGNTISGNVKVERFILARRAWRFLTAPISATGAQSTKAAWQEGQSSGNNIPGYGTQITGGTIANGFDQSPTNSSSFKKYNNSTNSWTAITSTNNPVTDSAGYMLFVRGSRSIDLSLGAYATPSNTVLRSTGQLKSGNQTYNVAAGNFTVIGNPYASPVDFNQIAKTNSTNIQDNIYLWDPKLNQVGGFINVSYNGGTYDITPSSPSGLNQYIQSGSAFFVKTVNGATPGTLVIKETDKSNSSMQVNRPLNNIMQKIRTNLYSINDDGTTSVVDGILNSYADMYSNNIDKYDALKVGNFSENLSLMSKGLSLSVERRKSIGLADTIFLNMQQMKTKSYQFEFIADNFNSTGVTVFLEDSYFNTSTQLDLNGRSTYNFDVINVPASWNPGRFKIVFRPITVLPITFISVNAFRLNDNIEVDWKAGNETGIKQYEVERSGNGLQFIKVITLMPKSINNNTATYNWVDLNSIGGNNFYRIKSININGEIQYSSVVKVNMSKPGQIVLFTNLIVNGIIKYNMVNMPEGTYGVRLLNTAGQTISTKQIQHAEGNSTESIHLNSNLAKGAYFIEFTTPAYNKITNKVFVE